MIEYFKTEKIDDKLTAIRSRSGEIMYLIEGQNKAVLIDTSLGICGLRKLVESLTDKPVSVILTHGHVDHAMGAPEFENVYMNSKDSIINKKHSLLKMRKDYIVSNMGKEESWIFDDTNFVQPVSTHYKELTDGTVFDLGGISVEAYELAGHTKGSMVILVPEKELLITGDACNIATFLFDEDSLSVEEYRENLIRVQENLEGRFSRIFMTHFLMETTKDLIKNVINVCDDILAGRADDIEYHFMAHTSYIAKKTDEMGRRADGKEGNIIYNRENVMKR